MGLSASQGKLLFMTARISNNEFQQQSIAFAKERLSDASQQANDKYLDSLNATKYQVISGYNGSVPVYEDLTYNQLTGASSVAFGKQYLVKDHKNRTLVSSAVADAFKKYNGDFNKFLEELGYTQVDIDVKDNEKSTEAIHEAWDKYLVSVGNSIDGTDGQHILNFGYRMTEGLSYPTYNNALALSYVMKQGAQNLANNNLSIFKDTDGYYLSSGSTSSGRKDGDISLTPVTLYQTEEGSYYTQDSENLKTDDGGYYYERPALEYVQNEGVIFTDDNGDKYSVSGVSYEQKFIFKTEDETGVLKNQVFDGDQIWVENNEIKTGNQRPVSGVYDLIAETDEGGNYTGKVYYKKEDNNEVYLAKVKYGAFLFDGEYYDNLYASKTPEGDIVISSDKKDRLTETTDKYTDNPENPLEGNIYAIKDLFKDGHGYYTNRIPLRGGYDSEGNPAAIYQTIGQEGTDFVNIANDVIYNENTGIFTWEGNDYDVLYVNPETGKISIEERDYINSSGDSDDGLKYVLTESTRALNYNGTTQEQRDLYDYAFALTEAFYNKDSAARNLKFDAGMVDYYRHLFSEMRANGYTTASDETNLKDSQWFVNQIKTGKLHIYTYKATEKMFVSTGLNEDESIIEKEDKSKIKIAEQEYNNTMDKIEAQEKQFDMQLNKLEAEYQALTTERESLNNVIKNNVEKSFGTFKSVG